MKRYFLFILLMSALGLHGCINTPADAEECYKVEELRCEMRGRCYLNFDVEGCKYYYKEQCRGREIVPDYTDDEMQSCLDAIAGFGDKNSECEALAKADEKEQSELCSDIEDLEPCEPLACEDVYNAEDSDDDESDDEADDEADDDNQSSGSLDPQDTD